MPKVARMETIFLDDTEYDGAVKQPADEEKNGAGYGNRKQRVYSVLGEDHRHITAQHDEFALGDIDDLHHPPDQGHAIGGKREYGANQQAVQNELDVEDRCFDKNAQIARQAGNQLRKELVHREILPQISPAAPSARRMAPPGERQEALARPGAFMCVSSPSSDAERQLLFRPIWSERRPGIRP